MREGKRGEENIGIEKESRGDEEESAHDALWYNGAVKKSPVEGGAEAERESASATHCCSVTNTGIRWHRWTHAGPRCQREHASSFSMFLCKPKPHLAPATFHPSHSHTQGVCFSLLSGLPAFFLSLSATDQCILEMKAETRG
ncbi:unnamed protein product [Pleuronectes platessa]|uniref:Uncharacterized protein n=1 Tax=Pleuronectes platessa TaxID=8262 RepID=A0A9N7TZA4_PLEPL|nr:unnamed protein product [Pleuronectes platessa]